MSTASAASTPVSTRGGIAVVGMACRVPGAVTPDEFWSNLCGGVESIRTFTREELLDTGMDPGDLDDRHHVPVGALIDVEDFDASFFGFTAREAEVMDPQHRVFLECAWQALEHAGYDPARYDGAISVFGGGIFDSYVTVNLVPAGVFDDKSATLQTVLANEKDYMTTRVSYKLNLRGPSYTVQSGCSTSLVAIHLACQNLLNYESDMALAGGVAVDVSRNRGYWAHPGSVHSADGHCRAFDEKADGTVFGNGAGIVVLKRLEDAIEDGDTIYAVVLGSATNNDGSLKVGFTAPSLVGQSKVIAEALADAGVTPETIGYVEAHGTGTALGDPIEFEAMTKAFASSSIRPRSCAIGSVKTNIGHLDAAAGVSGFIKAVLALWHRQIPPTLHYSRPNPKIDLAASPFFVADRLIDWTTGTAPGVPRRAGVSSFGMGGTNAHVILEEAPSLRPAPVGSAAHVLVLSARSGAALDAATVRLADHFREGLDVSISDVAHTLQSGRAIFAHRRAIVCGDRAEAMAALDDGGFETHEHDGNSRTIAFLFPGQGSQFAGMGRALYVAQPVFRDALDACFDVARRASGVDLAALMFAADGDDRLRQTDVAQPALFSIEYALARQLGAWGIEPAVCLGHSVGEYVAACLAGVFSLEHALELVVVRGQLMQTLPPGAMTAVPRPASQIRAVLGGELSVAAMNSPATTVVAGPIDGIVRFEEEMRNSGAECRRLRTSHAFHSWMVEPILSAFREKVARVPLKPPVRPFVSNLTGRLITAAEATTAEYWTRHLRETVQFAQGVRELAQNGAYHFLEVGPGRALSALVRQQVSDRNVLTIEGLTDVDAGEAALLKTVGRLWTHGAAIDWQRIRPSAGRRVALPTYPFERSRFWIDPKPPDRDKELRRKARTKTGKPPEWLYVPGWRQSAPARFTPDRQPDAQPGSWLVFHDECALCTEIVAELHRRAARVISIRPATHFQQFGPDSYGIVPGRREDYVRLVEQVAAASDAPIRVAHLWQACPTDPAADADVVAAAQERGFYSVTWLAQALARADDGSDVTISIVTSDAQDVLGGDSQHPEHATVGGPCLVIPQEYPHMRCQWIDVAAIDSNPRATAGDLAAELLAGTADPTVAYRLGRRWVPAFEHLAIDDDVARDVPRRQGGVVIITGGFGHLGFSFAYCFAREARSRLVLVSRSTLPPRPEWQSWLLSHAPDDPTSVRIAKLLTLERLGSEVLVVVADVADVTDMQRVVGETVARFGTVDAVIAAAGVADGSAFAPISAVDRPMCDAQFRPKLRGLLALEAALGDRPLDFCLVVSSISSIIGGPGYLPYAAANRFMDAFVARHNQLPNAARWVVVNWDAWQRPDGQTAGSALARLALTMDEALHALGGVLSVRHLGQVVVSSADLDARVFAWTTRRGRDDQQVVERATYSRPPEIESAYEAPATPVEAVVAEVWQQVLGIDRVGMHDTFLDLGGNSLNAIQVIGRLHERLGARLSIEEFIFQTARQLAAICEARSVPAASAAAGAPAAGGWFGSMKRMVRGEAGAVR